MKLIWKNSNGCEVATFTYNDNTDLKELFIDLAKADLIYDGDTFEFVNEEDEE